MSPTLAHSRLTELPVPEAVLQFDGPPNWHVMGLRYLILCSAGLKEDGAEIWDYASAEQAVAAYHVVLPDFVSDAEQIAWRVRPEIRSVGGRFYVYSRLAVWRTGS